MRCPLGPNNWNLVPKSRLGQEAKCARVPACFHQVLLGAANSRRASGENLIPIAEICDSGLLAPFSSRWKLRHFQVHPVGISSNLSYTVSHGDSHDLRKKTQGSSNFSRAPHMAVCQSTHYSSCGFELSS